MVKIRSKSEVLMEYSSRYPKLDKYFLSKLSKEYDRYEKLLKDCKTIEEAYEVFENEIAENERRFTDNAKIKCLEGSTHQQYMEILAQYGLIVFFRDNMLVYPEIQNEENGDDDSLSVS